MEMEDNPKFNELRDRFISRTTDSATRLDALMREMREPVSPEADEVLQIAHRLAGTAGTFGFSDLSVLADYVEQEIERLRQAESRDINGLITACSQLKAALLALSRRD